VSQKVLGMMKRMIEAGENLPGPSKKLLGPIWRILSNKVILDKRLIRDLVEFYNLNSEFKLNEKEAMLLCKLGNRLTTDYWNMLSPKTEEEIKEFYKTVPYYLFDIAYYSGRVSRRLFLQKVIELSFGDVLDYGGGIGDLSLELAKRGMDVTYVDVQSKNMEFAKMRFQKYCSSHNIQVLDVDRDQEKIWRKHYDTIICLGVIEHISRPRDILYKMAKSLRKDGRLIITELNCSGPTPNAPTHFKITFDAEKLLNTFGLFKEGYDWIWVKRISHTSKKGTN